MAAFIQTHSISKRLMTIILLIATFFILEFIGMYYSSQNLIEGLGKLHVSIRSITQIRQLRQLINTRQDFLKRAQKKPLTADEIVILKSSEEQVHEFFALNLSLTQNHPQVHQLITDAQTALIPLDLLCSRIVAGEKNVVVNPLIVEQYVMEAQDHLGKVQLVLADDSDQIFNEVYAGRFIPLSVGLSLSALFVLFAVGLGINLKNKIDRPIQNLIAASNALSEGHLNVRAVVEERNEVGALTNAFNMMAGKLDDNTKERKIAAQDLMVAKEAAEAASRAKSAFLANMSHEIRTPLGAVLGFADLVIDPHIGAEEKSGFVAAIRRNGELLSNIINDILDLSKIEAGKMQISTSRVTLSDILSDTKTLLGLQAKEKGIELKVIVEPDVPEIVQTDALRLRQVMINIVGNAIKFTSKGSVNVNVEWRQQNKKNVIAFVVQDTGSGIASHQIENLFSSFSQADASTKRKFGGTGLGLILSKRFANLLGGDVVLSNSTFEVGSTFVVTIDPGVERPGAERALANTLMKSSAEPTPTKISSSGQKNKLAGVRVLLAEDSEDNQVLFTHVLELTGAAVELATNGEEAVAMALKNKYDVILMDIQMPIMDGYEATAHLRKQGYRGRIFALTAHALNEDRELSLRSGFDDHISKPINRDMLIQRIKSVSQI